MVGRAKKSIPVYWIDLGLIPSRQQGVCAVFPLRKSYIEQMFVLVNMQLRNHVDTQLVER